MFQHRLTRIPGCVEIFPDVHEDARGRFVKTYQEGRLAHLSIPERYAEHFYTISRKNVLRGLHLQIPPAEHAKLVYCTDGTVLDAVVDLRTGSPTFQAFELVELCMEHTSLLYIPPGCAHGFLTLTQSATIHYCVTTVHDPALDRGIRWDSVGIPWPIRDPILSDRDRALPPMAEFHCAFRWSA